MISDINSPRMQSKILLKVRETLNEFIRGSGIDVTEVTIGTVNVIQNGENQTINLFQQVLASDVGKQLLGALGSQAAELLAQSSTVATPESGSHISFTSMMTDHTARTSLSSASTIPMSSVSHRKQEYDVPSNSTLDTLIEQVRRW